MTITGQPATSLLESILDAGSARQDIGIAVLKKAQDAEKQQGEAMVNLLEQAGQPQSDQRLDVLA
ncbi:MAG: YjfB family protein [Verrucomicrobiota bacterium]|jgi:hypothetical protein|nr:YjfB family protein [Verrucomicrobiota bacterium]